MYNSDEWRSRRSVEDESKEAAAAIDDFNYCQGADITSILNQPTLPIGHNNEWNLLPEFSCTHLAGDATSSSHVRCARAKCRLLRRFLSSPRNSVLWNDWNWLAKLHSCGSSDNHDCRSVVANSHVTVTRSGEQDNVTEMCPAGVPSRALNV